MMCTMHVDISFNADAELALFSLTLFMPRAKRGAVALP
jgi:hypothetical protein